MKKLLIFCYFILFIFSNKIRLFGIEKDYGMLGLRHFPVYLPWNGDEEFVEISNKIELNYHLNVRYYQYIFAKYCLSLQGSFIECGCNTGLFPDLVGCLQDKYSSSKKIFTIDSFEGLESPDPMIVLRA